MAVYYTNPYSQTAPPQVPVYQQPQFTNVFAWVPGKAAAEAFFVSPGTTAVLMDTENPILYMKSTDQMGKPSEMQIRYLVSKDEYDRLQAEPVVQNSEINYATKEDLEALLAEVNEKFVLRKEYRQNAKSSV